MPATKTLNPAEPKKSKIAKPPKKAEPVSESTIDGVQRKKLPKLKKERSTSTKGHYVKNDELIPEILACKANGNKLSDKLAKMLMMIAERYSYSPSFANYSFREDMVAIAVMNLCANWHKFDVTKSDKPNPFSYYTTACYRSFLQYLADEKTERDGRDLLLIQAGANPSFNFQERSRSGKTHDDTAFRGSSSGVE